MDILDAMHDPALFEPAFRPLHRWAAWETVLAALFACRKPTKRQLALYRECTGRQHWPTQPCTEAALIVGRRGGKSRILALIGTFLALFRDYRPYLAPGEVPVCAIIASDRIQARIILKYCAGMLKSSDLLAEELQDEIVETLRLNNGVEIQIHTGKISSPRGRTYICVLCDEIAFWRSEDSADPDREVIAAVRPGLATIPGSLLLLASSPYSRRGVLWQRFKRDYGRDDARVLVWKAPTKTMNPSLPAELIQEAYEDDPASAAAEYGAEFRSDVESYISEEVLDASTIPGRHELPPRGSMTYQGFVDPSGGSADSFTLAIAHAEGETGILDCIREVRPPFSPESVVDEFCQVLAQYGITRVTGDRYAGEWPREQFSKRDVTYETSERSKSDIYRELLPLLNSGKAELLELKTLRAQLLGLERRTARGGRDSIDHGPSAHDDVANAAAGVLVAVAGKANPLAVWERLCSGSGNLIPRGYQSLAAARR